MALFSFGRKDKKPAEVAPPVTKTPPTPPKIQTPPGTASLPSVKAPQPTGLAPVTPSPAGAFTTAPMTIPRTGPSGLKPTRPGTGTRSTQRIVLPTPPGARAQGNKTGPVTGPGGRISLPIGMILRCLPPEVLAADVSEFEKNGSAATEIGLPMNSILNQLPSGKVEMPLQELVPHFPPGFLQPTESIASYLPNIISLPLMDVVMRIPPDLLALRPDQKDVDASVINMADPFTEEILREQAEAARRQSGANIIEESQAPQEEFVPQDRVAATAKSVTPPRRPTVEPLIPTRTAATTLSAPPATPPAGPLRPPASATGTLPTPGVGTMARVNPILPTTPGAPTLAPTPSEAPTLPVPVRATTSLPRPAGTIPTPSETASSTTAPVPPVPRHTGPIPAPPPPRHTTALPTVPRRSGSLASLSQRVGMKAEAAATKLVEITPAAEPVSVPAPADSPDDLQRLAALAMAQLGDETSDTPALAQPVTETPAPTPVQEPIRAPEPAATAPTTEPASSNIAPIVAATIGGVSAAAASIMAASSTSSPAPTPAPEPASVAPVADESIDAAIPAVAFNLNTCTVEDLVKNIPGCTKTLAESIIKYRDKTGTFKKVEDLMEVPGMTKETYTELTGEAPPAKSPELSLNDLLGFPESQHLSLKDVTDRISCWPDVTGCLLSQSTGLSLVGTVPKGLDKEAVVAFAPRMFDSINKSFSELSGQETDALVIPTIGTSYHLFRNGDLYLIVMSRLPQMPDRHVKVARFVLAALATRKD